jgi:hypothetical protein
VRRGLLIAVVIGILAGGLVEPPAGLRSNDDSADGVSLAGVPQPIRPAFTPGPPEPVGSTRFLSRWATVRRPVAARRRPDAVSASVGSVSRVTPEGTVNIVRVLGHRSDGRGRLWVRVALATLPNGRAGWVPRTALGGYGTADTRLVVDRMHLTLTLLRRGRAVFHAPVAVGTRRWPTPAGDFYVRNRLTRYAGPTYGPLAFGTNARSVRLSDWPDGGFIGIHGTNRPELIPGRVSHGCIRMRNADIVALAKRMPVGTPLTIR